MGILATPEVIAAQAELLKALRAAVAEKPDLPKDSIEAALSALYCGLWNHSERMLDELKRRKSRN